MSIHVYKLKTICLKFYNSANQYEVNANIFKNQFFVFLENRRKSSQHQDWDRISVLSTRRGHLADAYSPILEKFNRTKTTEAMTKQVLKLKRLMGPTLLIN